MVTDKGSSKYYSSSAGSLWVGLAMLIFVFSFFYWFIHKITGSSPDPIQKVISCVFIFIFIFIFIILIYKIISARYYFHEIHGSQLTIGVFGSFKAKKIKIEISEIDQITVKQRSDFSIASDIWIAQKLYSIVMLGGEEIPIARNMIESIAVFSQKLVRINNKISVMIQRSDGDVLSGDLESLKRAGIEPVII